MHTRTVEMRNLYWKSQREAFPRRVRTWRGGRFGEGEREAGADYPIGNPRSLSGEGRHNSGLVRLEAFT